MTDAARRSPSDATSLPLVLVTSLFLLWALGVNLNDILIPHLKKLFGLHGLSVVAHPDGVFRRLLPGGVAGRLGHAAAGLSPRHRHGPARVRAGAALFIPGGGRARVSVVPRRALRAGVRPVLPRGRRQSVRRRRSARAESAPWRLNTAQAFNSLGAVITPIIGATFILSGIEHTAAETAAMSPAELDAYRAMEASMMRGPYLTIAGIFLVMAAIFWRAHLPEVAEDDTEPERRTAGRRIGRRHLVAHASAARRARAVLLRGRAGRRRELRHSLRAAGDARHAGERPPPST